jgi:hypothetical protein
MIFLRTTRRSINEGRDQGRGRNQREILRGKNK